MLELCAEILSVLWIRNEAVINKGNKEKLKKNSKLLRSFLILSFLVFSLNVYRTNQANGGVWNSLTLLIFGVSIIILVIKVAFFLLITKYCDNKISLKQLITIFIPLSAFFVIDILISGYTNILIGTEFKLTFIIYLIGRIVTLLLMLNAYLKMRKNNIFEGIVQ